jgi:hypothetical protein
VADGLFVQHNCKADIRYHRDPTACVWDVIAAWHASRRYVAQLKGGAA